MNEQNETINYLTINQATELVERIAKRAEKFGHVMHDNEVEAMAELLSDIGVITSDLIDVNNLADNYAINAEIVYPSDVDSYDRETLEDALFCWDENGETVYCIQW